MSIYLKITFILILLLLAFYSGTIFALRIKKYDKPTIMIDFDGVLNNYKYYDKNNLPEIKDGAIEFIKQLDKKYALVIFTTREKYQTKNG